MLETISDAEADRPLIKRYAENQVPRKNDYYCTVTRSITEGEPSETTGMISRCTEWDGMFARALIPILHSGGSGWESRETHHRSHSERNVVGISATSVAQISSRQQIFDTDSCQNVLCLENLMVSELQSQIIDSTVMYPRTSLALHSTQG